MTSLVPFPDLVAAGESLDNVVVAAQVPGPVSYWTNGAVKPCDRGSSRMKTIAQMLRAHRDLILNYFKAQKQFSSGVVEA